MHLLAESARRSELPRERLSAVGILALSDHELASLMIGSGIAGHSVSTVASALLQLIDAANGLPAPERLLSIAGLGPAKVASIQASFELARRILRPARVKVRSPSDILPVVDRFAERQQECFLSVSLNGAHEVVAARVVTVGLVNRTIVHPREVFADPLTDRAAAVVLAHNHPSGSLEPSEEDREVTRRLVTAGHMLGVPVLDHVIFTACGYYSFLEHNQL